MEPFLDTMPFRHHTGRILAHTGVCKADIRFGGGAMPLSAISVISLLGLAL